LRPAQITNNEAGPTAKQAKMKVLTPGLPEALDRAKLSSRKATHVLREMASSLGHDVNAITIIRSTIDRARANQRAAKSAHNQSQFSAIGCSKIAFW